MLISYALRNKKGVIIAASRCRNSKKRFCSASINSISHPKEQISNRFNAKTKTHLYAKWGLNNQSKATSRLQVIFYPALLFLCNVLRHFLSLRTIAQTFLLSISLQLAWLYKGHSGYCFDISISWASFHAFWEGSGWLLQGDRFAVFPVVQQGFLVFLLNQNPMSYYTFFFFPYVPICVRYLIDIKKSIKIGI